MSQFATRATQNDMTTCLETFEKERFRSFPHRHGDATGKPETRDETRGRRKTSISCETSSYFGTFDTLSNRLECHKVPRLPRKTTWQPARWAKNCSLKIACRPRRARVKAQVGQKLLPKDCLPAAAAAQRSPRSAETLSLKHLPGGPGRPNQYQKIKKCVLGAPLYPFLGKYMPFFSSREPVGPLMVSWFGDFDWMQKCTA